MFLKNSDTDHFTDLIRAFWAIDPFSDLYTFGCVPSLFLNCLQLAKLLRNPTNCKQLRPYTWGKRFLLFLPDSHSAYHDSFVSALGRSLPPSLGLSRICCTWSSFWRKRRVGRGGGWWDHPPALATLGKMALGTSVGFLGIGRSD